MTNADIREAYKLLDYVSQGRAVLDEEIELLRSFLPDLPKQKALKEIAAHVYGALLGTSGNDWTGDKYDADVTLEAWLSDLHAQLRGLADAEPAKAAHPEFLETEADYQNAPEGTVVSRDSINPWVKEEGVWVQGSAADAAVYTVPCLKGPRRVLRWGNK